MLFNSMTFLVFFAVVVLMYYSLAYKHRWVLLFVASCIFYSAFVPEYLLILFAIILIDYWAARIIDKVDDKKKKKIWLGVSILSTCSILVLFKYFNFFSVNISALATFFHWNYDPVLLKWILPIGLSFHTFQSLSYVFEVYHGRQQPEKHLGIYATYVMFFPQLVAGPIERPQNLLPQFREKYPLLYKNFSIGFRLALYGFFKKMVIADNLAPYVDQVYNNPDNYGAGVTVLVTFFFAVQIYCDFSGYSDIALGTARIMGFKLMTNFRQPYFSTSIPEFWRRWHISLSTWFRDYVYVPLGGNKVDRWRWYYNLFIVFLLSGIWHGAGWTFVIWGLLHWGYYLFYYSTKRVRTRMAHLSGLYNYPAVNSLISGLVTFLAVVFAWIAFRAKDIATVNDMLHNMIALKGSFASDIKNLVRQVQLAEPASSAMHYIVCSLLVFIIVEIAISYKRTLPVFVSAPRVLRWGTYYGLLIWIYLFGVYDNAPHFIYFQF